MEYNEPNNMEPNELTPRIPPHNDEAEKSVLGAMLMSQYAVDRAVEVLGASDFYAPNHRYIFEAMLRLYNSSKAVDIVTVMDELDGMGKLKSSGGATYLTELSVYTPSASNIMQYAEIVREHSKRRKTIELGGVILDDAHNPEKDIEATLEEAERSIFKLQLNRDESALQPIAGAVMASHKRIGELIALDGKIPGLPTGFIDLDRMLTGLKKGNMIIVAARPAMGKTSFALNIATHAGLREGASVAIFSLEMSAEELAMRMICAEACVNMQGINQGNPSEEDLIKIGDTVGPLERSNIFVDHRGNISVAEMRAECRRLKTRVGLDLVIIDYLQLMQMDSSKNTAQAIGDLTRSLKIMAGELEVPVIVLSQVNRGPDKDKNDHRPKMSDLRDSGAIEQDADIVLMLYRPQVYEEADNNLSEVIVLKNRNGSIGTVKLAWIPEYTRFMNSTEGSGGYYGG